MQWVAAAIKLQVWMQWIHTYWQVGRLWQVYIMTAARPAMCRCPHSHIKSFLRVCTFNACCLPAQPLLPTCLTASLLLSASSLLSIWISGLRVRCLAWKATFSAPSSCAVSAGLFSFLA